VKIDRHQARILAMQMLCQLDVQGDEALEQLDGFLAGTDARPRAIRYAADLVRSVWARREALDARVSGQLEHWQTERLSPVERNLIRVALVELSGPDVPPKVAINEAIEIGREFGGADSPKFVNGVLDALWKQDIENDG